MGVLLPQTKWFKPRSECIMRFEAINKSLTTINLLTDSEERDTPILFKVNHSIESLVVGPIYFFFKY